MKINLRPLTSLIKVFLDEAPAAFGGATIAEGFQNEVLSFQVAYCAEDATNEASCFADLKVESPILSCLRARRVINVPVGLAAFPDADEHYLRYTPGLYPDLLQDVETSRIRVYLNQWHALWFDIAPGATLAPGEYPVHITLSDTTITVTVRILSGLLPKQTLRHTKWFHCDCLANYYNEPVWTERFWGIVENFITAAVKQGINMILTPIHTPPLDTGIGGERLTTQLVDISLENGRYTFCFKKLRRFVELCRRAGVEYYEMAHLFTQWGAYYTPKIMAKVEGVEQRIFGWDVSAASETYRAFLSAYLPALTKELHALGIADKTYFHISDEPSQAQLESYAAAKALAAPYLKGFQIIDALSDIAFYNKGLVEKPIPANNHIDPFIAADIKGLWTYYCLGQYKDVSNMFMAMPSYRNRILGVQLYKYNIEGFLQWGYNFYNAQYSAYAVNPFLSTDADGFTPSGDAFQVYPGAGGIPLESLRMMVTSQALYDLRALKWLESLTDKAYVLSLIEEGLSSPVTFSSYPHSDEYLLALRTKINHEIQNRIC